jgi:hypothetical protein
VVVSSVTLATLEHDVDREMLIYKLIRHRDLGYQGPRGYFLGVPYCFPVCLRVIWKNFLGIEMNND